ncbi:PACE efflux transporter [Pseudomonas sp. PB3P13]
MIKQKISIKERILHAVGYELIAAGICAPVLTLIFNKPLASTGALALSLSLFAMLWNAIYNTFFDKWCKAERSAWTFKTRILHGIGFELGIITVCLPIGMWMLDITLLEAFLLEAGFFAFVLPYTIFYNWAFEKVKVASKLRKSTKATIS